MPYQSHQIANFNLNVLIHWGSIITVKSKSLSLWNRQTMEIDQCYELFGLTSNATLEDVNKAYKALALLWHPDRIPRENVQQQLHAQEKLKEINHARDSLRKAAEQQESNSQARYSQQNKQTHQHQTKYQSKYQSAYQSHSQQDRRVKSVA